MKKYKVDYLFINVIIGVLFIFNFVTTIICWQLYSPQAEIVLHDYGQVFETIEDWKIWRIEHNI